MLLLDKQNPDSGFYLPIAEPYTLVNCVIVEHFVALEPDTDDKSDNERPTKAHDHLEALPFIPKGENAAKDAAAAHLQIIGNKDDWGMSVRANIDNQDEDLIRCEATKISGLNVQTHHRSL